MRNTVSGELKELSEAELLAMFAEDLRPRISAAARSKPGIEAVVVFENLQLDSSQCGHRQALIMGPGCEWPLSKVEEPGFRLGDVPSRFTYPVAFWRVPALA